jgi:acetyl esterase/lipase
MRCIWGIKMNIVKSVFTVVIWLITFGAQAETFAYLTGNGNATALDVYAPIGAENAPVMVYVHGGAWVTGDKSRVHRKDDFFLDRGYVFISVNYSLVPQATVERQLEEIDAAIGYIVANVAQAGGNPNNISLMGHSAGAHLVTMTALRPLTNAQALLARGGLRAVISNDTRSYNIPRIARESGGSLEKTFGRPFGADPARWAALSPQLQIDSGDAGGPTFLIAHSGQGNANRRASYAADFANALRAVGISVQVYDGRQYSHAQINKGIGLEAGITKAIAGFVDSVQ